MPLKKFLLFGLFLFFTSSLFSQEPFQENDISYQYDPNCYLHFDYTTYFQEDSVQILISLTLNKNSSNNWQDDYKFYLAYKADYKESEVLKSDTINMSKHMVGYYDNNYLFRLVLPQNDEYELIEFTIKPEALEEELVYGISLLESLNYGKANIFILDDQENVPIIQNYFLTDQKVRFQSSNDQRDETLWIYYYDAEFDMAIPPMIVDDNQVSKSLSISKLISVKEDSITSFANEGLYFVQRDTSSLEGVAFRVQKEPFPKFGTYEDLIKPLKYISTRDENQELSTEDNPKSQFENYWFSLLNSQNLAQSTIKEFYNRVYEANFFFTGYKEGWRTDMGMIYLVYGQPDKVFRHEEYEEWIYNQNINMPAIRFTFVKIKNVFADNHYTLVRDRKFDKHWFRAVELWRKGKK